MDFFIERYNQLLKCDRMINLYTVSILTGMKNGANEF